MRRSAILAASLVLASLPPALAGDAFDRLKGLEGTWKGTHGGGGAEFRYEVTAAPAFASDGGTNIDPAKIEFEGRDALRAVWAPWAEGKAGEPMVFHMKRAE